MDSSKQKQLFEEAMAAFHKRNFAGALELFQQASEGPEVDLAHSAETHRRMCVRRLDDTEPDLRSPEELYTYGVSLMNRGAFGEAETVLRQALRKNEQAGHVHYAIAVCSGQLGDGEAAAHHLRRAIELSPDNLTAARNDSDFQKLARIPQIRQALGL